MIRQRGAREEDRGPDRRRYKRHALRCQCWLEGEALTVFGSTVDVGVGGLFLRTAVPVAEGSIVGLTLKIEREPSALEARALVARSVPAKTGVKHGLGLEFMEISSGEHALESLLSRSVSLAWLL